MAKRGDRIWRRSDGRWEGRVKIGTYPNGKTKYKSLYGKSYKDVREKMDRFDLTSVLPIKPECSTLNEIIYYWLKNSNINRKGSTVHKYEYLIENHISTSIGNQNRRFNRRFAPPLKGVNTGFAPKRGF